MDSLVQQWKTSATRAIYLSTKAWAWWLLKKSGSLAWIFGTTLILVGFPLVLEIEREQAMIDMENQQRQQGFGAGQYTPGGFTPLGQTPGSQSQQSPGQSQA